MDLELGAEEGDSNEFQTVPNNSMPTHRPKPKTNNRNTNAPIPSNTPNNIFDTNYWPNTTTKMPEAATDNTDIFNNSLSPIPATVNSSDYSIGSPGKWSDYTNTKNTGGYKKRRTNKKRTNKKRTNKKRTNKKKTNKKKTNKKRKHFK